ncbi:MAG: hypothetical protein JJE55_08075 [Flavobacteriaceae bacterium]|nr:hypothetical protein [Flavobacteriaceae bacterium]
MKKVHSKVGEATETPPTPFLHFKLEIIEEKANIELHGKVKQMVQAICSAMEQKPDLAQVLTTAVFEYSQDNELILTIPQTQQENG